MCGAGGEGAERRGRERTRERTSERASERAGHFCAAPERLGACLGGHWTKERRDRQTAPGSRAAAARLPGRGDLAGCPYVPSSRAGGRAWPELRFVSLRVRVSGFTSPGVC